MRQRCVLSPLLFNMYLNDLPPLFHDTASDPLTLPDGTNLNCLLYADDLIILSRSKFGLQNCLDQLNNWCDSWKMEINLKKTEVMIFQKTTRKQLNPEILFRNKMLRITQEYNYLGTKLTTNGKFTVTIKELADKAHRAMMAINKSLKFHLLHPKLAIKLFDTIVSPILLYNSEVWGAYMDNDLNKWDKSPTEKIHIKFCKMYLNVNKKATNAACKGEMGKFPLIISIYKRMLNYISHINTLPDTAIVKQAFILSKQLYNDNKPSLYSNITKSSKH